MKTDRLGLRMTPTEKPAFQDAAELSGLAVSAWIGERLRAAARKELAAAGRQVSFMTRSDAEN
jgi:uncharacterized protein (DUF1778 family)